MSAKDEFIQIFSNNIHREGSDALLRWLESTDFFTAHGIIPAMRAVCANIA